MVAVFVNVRILRPPSGGAGNVYLIPEGVIEIIGTGKLDIDVGGVIAWIIIDPGML